MGDAVASTVNDALYTVLIESVSREIEAFIGYPLTALERTEFYTLKNGDPIVWLRVVPVASIGEVKIASTLGDFTTVDALVADTDYRLGDDGALYLNVDIRDGYQRARVRYTAGLGANDSAVITAAGDLAAAATMQVGEEWRRRMDPASVSIPGPKGAKALASPHGLLPRVREVLSRYRRAVVV
jgi:hypothetical protein